MKANAPYAQDGRDRPEVLAIIPARGGSKGLPRKNIRPLGGIPLIGYSIKPALAARNVTRVLLSTDDAEIADIGRSLGAEAPFLRPGNLAGDKSLLDGVKTHALDYLRREEGYSPDVVVVLMPTHPFRTVELLEFLVDRNIEGFSPVTTVRAVDHSSLTLYHDDALGAARSCMAPGRKACDHAPRTYSRPYGIYEGVTDSRVVRPYVHSLSDPASLVDIDTQADLRLAEKVLERGLFKPGWTRGGECLESFPCA